MAGRCVVLLRPGGMFSAKKPDVYVVFAPGTGKTGLRVERILAVPAGFKEHLKQLKMSPDAVFALEVTGGEYKRYLAMARDGRDMMGARDGSGLRGNPRPRTGQMTSADLPPPIPGMEGPFRYKTGFVLYWDPKEGQYYDRGKDMYLSIEEAESAMGTKNPTRNSSYQLSAKQKKLVDAYIRGGRDDGAGSDPDGKYIMEDLGIFWDDMDTHGLRTVRDAIDAYVPTINPIPNKGPLRRRAGTRDWIGKAITRPGKLGGAGFLSKSKAQQEKILRGCVAEYGYRSCLGSVMILERIPHLQARWGTRLAGLRHYLVRNFGGPGSFDPRSNPGDDFALVPEVSGCALCAVKSNPAFTEAMANPLHDLSAAQRRKKAKSAPRKKAKRTTSAVLRNAMRGT